MKKSASTWIILAFFRVIPLGIRKNIFKALFRLFYYFSSKQRLIALHNLERAFPDKDMGEIVKIAKGSYRNMAIMAAEFFELPTITKDNVHEWAEFEGLEHYNDALAKRKGILSIVAHFSNWELMAVIFPLVARPINIVYRPLDSPVMENLVSWVRTQNGNSLLEKEGSLIKIVRLLRANGIIGILNDQNVAAREGVFVDFFGRPACTAPGLAFLALRTGAPVLPTFIVRMESGKYRFIIQPAVDVIDTGDKKTDILANTQRFTKVVEDMVRQYPDQWFWVHQRWKTKTFQKE